MSNTAIAGKGASFSRWNNTLSIYEPIANINSIGGPSSTRETIDVTTLDSPGGYREFIGSLRDGGEISLSMNFFWETYALMRDDFENDDLQKYKIILPDSQNTSMEFSAIVTGLPLNIPLDDKVTCDITLKISGATTLDTTKEIISVLMPSTINLDSADNKQLSEIGLPSTVYVTYDNGTSEYIPVKWDSGTPTYNGGNPGTYNLKGVMTLPSGVVNFRNLTPVQVVLVA